MNDFLQLQTRSLTPYIFATATICMITVIAATVISWHEIRVMRRKNPDNECDALDRSDILFDCFFPVIFIVSITIAVVPAIGDMYSSGIAFNRNMQAVQSAYNIRDVRQDARNSGDALHTTVQAGRNSEQNTDCLRNMLASQSGSVAVTAISNGSDSLGHYIFRVDDNHRLRVYQDTGNGQHLITPAKQDAMGEIQQ